MTRAPTRITIVEDEGIVALDLRKRLEGLGYSVIDQASSGEQALELIRATPPDLVILDILLGGELDGIETAARIRARFRLPVIFLTAYADEATVDRAKITEPYGYILKPLKERELHTMIEMALYKHRMERRMEFLFHATSAISAEPLDRAARLKKLAQLAVPELADFSAVDLVQKDGSLRRMAVCDRAGLAGGPPERFLPGPGHPARTALSTGQMARGKEVTGAWADPLLDALGVDSYLIAPLAISGETIGTLTLATISSSGRAIDRMDESLVADLVRRAELSVEVAQLFEKAQEAIRARDDLVAFVSHDLRNPLSIVSTAVSVLRGLLPENPEKCRELLARVERSTKTMEELIKSLLDAARIEAGQFNVERRRLDLRSLLTEMLDHAHPLAARKQIRVELDAPAEPVELDGDRVRILQVLSNIVDNAIRYSPEHGLVRAKVERRADSVWLRISDSGPGIPREDRPFVFDRYWQAPGGRKPGTGLGLFIAKGIIEAHGGRIWVEDEAPSGAAFVFSLPR